MKARKVRKRLKKLDRTPVLFTRAVWKTLTGRERELNDGRGVEVTSASELRRAVRRSKSAA